MDTKGYLFERVAANGRVLAAVEFGTAAEAVQAVRRGRFREGKALRVVDPQGEIIYAEFWGSTPKSGAPW